MNEDRLNTLLRDMEPSEAAEIREFAHREPWEQNVYLFREIKGLKKSKTLQDRLYDYGMAGALVAYLLFDQRANIPGLK